MRLDVDIDVHVLWHCFKELERADEIGIDSLSLPGALVAADKVCEDMMVFGESQS
jgi:hypothetical protein